MNKLLLTSVLALAFALPAVSSYAGVNALGVHLPIERAEVSESTGGYVAEDFGDTFNVQKLSNDNSSITADNNGEKYVVFGVDLNSINNS